jgi:predicted N-formylglutamate amidohydrolase
MAETKILSRVEELEASFERRAKANGRTFEQEVEVLLEGNQPFTPEEGVAATRYFHSRYEGIQPSMTLDEIREGLM